MNETEWNSEGALDNVSSVNAALVGSTYYLVSRYLHTSQLVSVTSDPRTVDASEFAL